MRSREFCLGCFHYHTYDPKIRTHACERIKDAPKCKCDKIIQRAYGSKFS